MLDRIIDLLDTATAAPVVTKHGLVQLRPTPSKHTGGGQWLKIATDQDAPWSYWRLLGPVRRAPVESFTAAPNNLYTFPLRMVLLVGADECGPDKLFAIAESLRQLKRISKAVGAIALGGNATALHPSLNPAGEGLKSIPLQRVLMGIDITVSVTMDASCMDLCEDLTCSIVRALTVAKLRECLTAEQYDELCDCGSPSGPCDPGYVQLYDDAATPNPIGGLVTVPAGTTVPVTAPHGTVMDTSGAIPVMDVLSGGSANLPSTFFEIQKADGTVVFTAPFNTVFDSGYGFLFPDVFTPRRELKDSNGDGIGIYASFDGLIDDTTPDIPDSEITLPNGTKVFLKATQPYTVPRTDELEWVFAAGDGGSATITVDARYADSYDVFTDDGSSGTVEVRINGGSWAVPSGVVTLALGDTLEARRSVWSAQGWLRFERVVSV